MRRIRKFIAICSPFTEVDSEIVKAKRATRERPISFTKMDDIKNRWETTSQQGRREVQREARKEEIAGIRSRLFMVISRSFSTSSFFPFLESFFQRF